jgi:hypothetical protein
MKECKEKVLVSLWIPRNIDVPLSGVHSHYDYFPVWLLPVWLLVNIRSSKHTSMTMNCSMYALINEVGKTSTSIHANQLHIIGIKLETFIASLAGQACVFGLHLWFSVSSKVYQIILLVYLAKFKGIQSPLIDLDNDQTNFSLRLITFNLYPS